MNNEIMDQAVAAVFTRLGLRIDREIEETDYLINKNAQALLNKFPWKETVEILDGLLIVWGSDTPVAGIKYLCIHFEGEFFCFAAEEPCLFDGIRPAGEFHQEDDVAIGGDTFEL